MMTRLFSVHVKTLADSTLRNMSKDKLIEYVRMCERNTANAYETLDQQAINFKKLLDEGGKLTGRWKNSYCAFVDIVQIVCSCCGHTGAKHFNFCPNCGAYMRGEEE